MKDNENLRGEEGFLKLLRSFDSEIAGNRSAPLKEIELFSLNE
jgi:hypothetical protein